MSTGFTEQSFADSNKLYNLNVNIINNSSGDCFLTKNQVLYGEVYPLKIPDVIYYGETVHFKMNPKSPYPHKTAVVLTYQCGPAQEITLFSNYIWTWRDYILDGVALNPTNLTAKVSYEKPQYNIPPTITWTLINP